MSTYEKIKCPYGCGEEVSSMPGPLAMHKKKSHPDAQTIAVEAQLRASEPVVDNGTVVAPVVAKVEQKVDSKMKDLLMKAKAAQDTFKKAPQVFVSSQTSDEMLELRKMYLPDSLGRNATVHCYFGLESQVEQYAAKGYAPVTHPVTGGYVRFNELVMLSLPIEIFKAMEKRAQDESRARMGRAVDTKFISQADAKLSNGEPTSGVGLRVEEYSTETKTIG